MRRNLPNKNVICAHTMGVLVISLLQRYFYQNHAVLMDDFKRPRQPRESPQINAAVNMGDEDCYPCLHVAMRHCNSEVLEPSMTSFRHGPNAPHVVVVRVLTILKPLSTALTTHVI
jgi:hypothetical protein